MPASIKTFLVTRLVRLATREDGQTLVEYSLVLVIVSLAAIAALTGIGDTVKGFFANVADDFG